VKVHPLTGQPAPPSLLVNVPRLVTAYDGERPHPEVPSQRVTVGTSGHRGSSLEVRFGGIKAVYKLYAESFKGPDHTRRIQERAQAAIQNVFRAKA
jgi:phosphoglucomutase